MQTTLFPIGASAFAKNDVGPASLSHCAARTIALWMLERLDGLKHCDPPFEFPTSSDANQDIFDALRDEGPISDECVCVIMKCFGPAPISDLCLRGSTVTTCTLRRYLQDAVRARAVSHLNVSETSELTFGISDVVSNSAEPVLPHLQVLDLGCRPELLWFAPQPERPDRRSLTGLNPKLKALILNGSQHWVEFFTQMEVNGRVLSEGTFFNMFLQPIPDLLYLDLSYWKFPSLQFVHGLTHLSYLVLHDVPDLYRYVQQVCHLDSLKGLDLSQSNKDHGRYPRPAVLLDKIITSLRQLESLDISGTNLTDYPDPETDEWPKVFHDRVESDIVGLRNLQRPLQYLGVLLCGRSCFSKRLPAERVAGTADWKQILTALAIHQGRSRMINNLLLETFTFFRSEREDDREYVIQCLGHFATIMKNFPHVTALQIACSASLFYLLRGLQSPSPIDPVPAGLRRRLIVVLIGSLERYFMDDAMSRNTCLNLCLLRLPGDVPADMHVRLASAILSTISEHPHDGTLVRFSCCVLKMLVSPVTLDQKKEVGAAGAIHVCLATISARQNSPPDDAMEILWSVLWSLTDECPGNSELFIHKGGMEVFCKAFETYKNAKDVVTAMSGLVGNMAEVRSLRHWLVRDDYIKIFVEMLSLDLTPENFETSYNAAGILVNLMAEVCIGDDDGTLGQPHPLFKDTMDRIFEAMSTWSLTAVRYISYRTFRPLILLLTSDSCRIAQVYAVWALANFTNHRQDNVHKKYCEFVRKEGALPHLHRFVKSFQNSDSPLLKELLRLSQLVLDNVQ